MNRPIEEKRGLFQRALSCAVTALMVLATVSGAGWAQSTEQKKNEPTGSAESTAEAAEQVSAGKQYICKPPKPTDQFNTLEDLFAADGTTLTLQALIGRRGPAMDESPVPWGGS